MKILHVIASVDPRGGGPIEGIFASAEVWHQHGHERHIVSLDVPDDPWILQSPVTTFAMGLGSRWYMALRKMLAWLRYGYTPHLTRWLKTHARNYDAIIVNGLWNYTSCGSWRALHQSDVPYFVFTHGMLDPWFNKAYPTKTLFKTRFLQRHRAFGTVFSRFGAPKGSQNALKHGWYILEGFETRCRSDLASGALMSAPCHHR